MSANPRPSRPAQTSRRRKTSAPTTPPDNPLYGYYARLFHPSEMEGLPASLEGGVQDEAAMLKVLIRRLYVLVDGSEDFGVSSRALQILGQASTRLAGLLETQQALSPPEDGVMADLSLALEDVLKMWGRK